MIALLPVPPVGLPEAARARHLRRQLAQAIDHGTDLLAALGLSRLVLPGAEPIDPAEVGDAIEQAIATLDAADAPAEDLEDEGHEELSLGWPERFEQDHLTDGFGEDEATLGWGANVSQLALGPNTEDGEHTLGAPERHPFVWTMTHPRYEPADGCRLLRHRRDASQASWAQGSRQDGEGEAEPGYDLPEGDDERCASGDVDGEPSLGWPEDPAAQLDSMRQAEADADRELDPLDDVHLRPPADPLPRDERFRLEQRAKDLRRRLRTGQTPAPRGGNLVPVDLRVLAAACPSLVGGARV